MTENILAVCDPATGAIVVTIAPCPADWPKPEAEFWNQLEAAGYVDTLLRFYPDSAVRWLPAGEAANG
jgi:hypothetical protein